MTIRCVDCEHPKHVHSPECKVLACPCKELKLAKPFGTGTFTPSERML